MSDASDVTHHIEEGLLQFVRGMVLEARQSWRKVLQLDAENDVAQDYLRSTDNELTSQERSRESEMLRASRQGSKSSGLPWEDDDFEVIAAGPSDDDDDSITSSNVDTVSITGFLVEEEESGGIEAAEAEEAAAPSAGGWVEAADDEGEADHLAPPVAGHRGAGDVWEPLDWVNEITPAASLSAMEALRGAQRSAGEKTPPEKVGRSSRRSRGGSESLPPPVEQSPDELLSLANQQLQQDQPELARKILLRLMDKNPQFPGAIEALEASVSALLVQYQEILGESDGVPQLNPQNTDLYSLNLDEVGGYVLSRIDGITTLDELYTLSAHLDRLHVMRILVELVKGEAITIHHDDAASE